jgi:hypothetical protein
VHAFGLRWVSMMMIVPVPWSSRVGNTTRNRGVTLDAERSLEILSKCKIDDMLVVIELEQVFDAW